MAGIYYPGTEGAQVIWWQNFIAKLGLYQVTLGLSAGDVTAATNDANAFYYMVNLSAIFKTRTQDINNYKAQLMDGPGPIGAFPGSPTLAIPPTAVLANVVGRLSALVNRIKAAPGYTNAIGEDLGIVGAPPPAMDFGLVKPEGSKAVALADSEIRISWSKGEFDGIVIESQRNNETEWTVIGQDFFSPFIDNREPLVGGIPEERRYRLRYLEGDTPVGLWSDVLTISTLP